MNHYMLNINNFTILFAFQWGLLGTLLIKNKKIKYFWFLTFWEKYCKINHVYFYYYQYNNYKFHQKWMVGNP